MKHAGSMLFLICAVAASASAVAQERGNGTSDAPDSLKQLQRSEGVPLDKVIVAVAKKSGKRFIVDNRVSGNVQILGQDLSAVTYNDLLSILLLNGDTAVEVGNYVNVIPESSVRQMPLPMATVRDSFPDGQFVTTIVTVKNVSALQLVPILRPLLPVYAHLAAVACGNSLILVDNFANVKRIEKLVLALDVGKPFATAGCDGESGRASVSAPK